MLGRYPLLPIVFGYAIGIFTIHWFTIATPLFFGILALGLLALVLLHSFRSLAVLKHVLPYVVFLLFLSFGNYRTVASSSIALQHHYSHFTTDTTYYWVGQIQEAAKWGAKRAKTKVAVTHVILSDSTQQAVCGDVLLYFPETDSLIPPPGTQLLFRGALTTPKGSTVPGGFDFKAYLAKSDIHHIIYLKEGDWQEHTREKTWRFYAEQFRNDLLQELNNYPIDSTSKAVAAALLLGYKDWMPTETRDAFSVAGATHILAVSGLHVGIVYMIMMTLLGMRNSTKGKSWKMPIIIACIWGYAFLTGLSPSVCRSATMFSFFAFSRLINRKGNTYHLLLISAFFLLLYDPRLIYQLSFQLSYAAVLAIVSFVPFLQRFWETENIIGKATRDILAVSIAAQMGTLPITLFHFQQFPTYFLFGNLFILPIIPLLMYFGLGSLVLKYFGLRFEWLEMGFGLLLDYMNKVVILITQLPNAQIITPKPSLTLVLVLAGFLIVFWWFWRTGAVAFRVASIVSFALLMGLQWNALKHTQNTNNLYLIASKSGIGTLNVHGKSATLFQYTDSTNYAFQILPILKYHGITDTSSQASLHWEAPILYHPMGQLLYVRTPDDLQNCQWERLQGIVWQYQGYVAIPETFRGKLFLDPKLKWRVKAKITENHPELIWDFRENPVWTLPKQQY